MEEQLKKETLGDLFNKFNLCEIEEDFIRFYRDYYIVCEKAVCDEQNVKWGETKPIGLIYERIRTNLLWLLSGVNSMRADFARKVWWFL